MAGSWSPAHPKWRPGAGHSVAVLLRVYADALDDHEGLSKRRIAAALEPSWPE